MGINLDMCTRLAFLIVLSGNWLMVCAFQKLSSRHGLSLDSHPVNPNVSLKGVVMGFHARNVGRRFNNITIKFPRSLINDGVSKNITMVLENLLKNYESSQLPTHGRDIPTIVQTNILIRSMGPVSELDMGHELLLIFTSEENDAFQTEMFHIVLYLQGSEKILETKEHNTDSKRQIDEDLTFEVVQEIPSTSTRVIANNIGVSQQSVQEYSMDCYFRQYWRDQRLSFFGPIKSLSLSIKMLERIWRPDTYFYNGKNSYVHTITVPNKLLRISQDGDILYSMRLTIKAKCPMELKSFPMDRQSCPLIFGSYAYTSKDLIYRWQNEASVNFVPGMTLSQFDLISSPYRNFTLKRREGDFSVLQVSFNLQRHTGYFLIQVYVPCILIVVLSWVSFWIHREATSDRVGLGITTVLTLSTISLDSRTDLPKVRYATALDWFLLMSFFYCIATLLEFAGVHYFTKVGSGEIHMTDDDWEECSDSEENCTQADLLETSNPKSRARKRNSIICPIYNNSTLHYGSRKTSLTSLTNQVTPPPPIRLTMERTTQTEYKLPKWKQFLYCLKGDDKFRRQREREAAAASDLGKGTHHGHHMRHVNSVSLIDRTARIVFPASFGFFNLFYWMSYFMTQENFKWGDTKLGTVNH